jgi:hypothetical protein
VRFAPGADHALKLAHAEWKEAVNTRSEGDGSADNGDKAGTVELRDPAFTAAVASPYVYLYYLRTTGNPQSGTEVYCLDRRNPIQPNGIEAEIRTIVGEIESGDHNPCGWRIGDVRWRRRSYMVFLLEDSTETLNTVIFTPGHAFRSGQNIAEFNSPHGKRITGYYCSNHMKKPDDSDVDGFGEAIRVHVYHTGSHGPPLPVAFGHEDTGTNLGPPIGSP